MPQDIRSPPSKAHTIPNLASAEAPLLPHPTPAPAKVPTSQTASTQLKYTSPRAKAAVRGNSRAATWCRDRSFHKGLVSVLHGTRPVPTDPRKNEKPVDTANPTVQILRTLQRKNTPQLPPGRTTVTSAEPMARP